MSDRLPKILTLPAVRALYETGEWTPGLLCAALAERIEVGDPAVFITRTSASELAAASAELDARAPVPNSLPLWGVPFAVKDNIDVAGLPTTASCPAFAHAPARDAQVVARLIAAGAIVLGKTNLDQFATGLNGTRSPYGAPRSVFGADYISGGSSSGSAVAVAAGFATFALGTDTAGSGRVPAAFNNIVGIKPTPGLLSTAGVVPACASLDCVSIFAATVEDGATIRRIAEGHDPADPYSHRAEPRELPQDGLRVGVLKQQDCEFFGDSETARLYSAAVAGLSALGHKPVEFDFAPFREAAALLYDGPWVAERLAAFQTFGVELSALDPIVAAVIDGGRHYSAAEAFTGHHRLAALRARSEVEWASFDVMLLPTAPTIYRVDEMLADPIRLNSRLGIYTNFCNLLGLAAIAMPAGFRADGLPAGVTLAGPGFSDEALVPLAAAFHQMMACGTGVDRTALLPDPPAPSSSEDRLSLVVVGAHLDGMALNHELLALGARLERVARTASDYRLFALSTVPPKPGLIRDPGFAGPGISVEIWSLPVAAFARFVEAIPAPLGIGKISLAEGSSVSGFLCEAAATEDAPDITRFGGWRAYIAAKAEALPT